MGRTIKSGDHPEINLGNLRIVVINPRRSAESVGDLLLKYKS